MVLVRCWSCGVVFEILEAPWCEGHREHETPDARARTLIGQCKICPNSHPLHDKPGFDLMARRNPTVMESILGFDWLLSSVPEGD